MTSTNKIIKPPKRLVGIRAWMPAFLQTERPNKIGAFGNIQENIFKTYLSIFSIHERTKNE